MRNIRLIAWFLLASTFVGANDNATISARRKRAAIAFHDGILIVHAVSRLDIVADGYRQDPYFYYFTGLENTVGALLAIDGKSGESWLFLPSHPPFLRSGLQPEVKAGPDAEKNLALKHVVDWDELKGFFASHSAEKVSLYFASGSFQFAELPGNLLNAKSPEGPAWLQLILQKWPAFEGKEAGDRIQDLMA